MDLIAYVFALWTLQNSQEYFDSSGDAADPKSYLLQPRAAQIVSILRLLSIDDKRNEIVRHLLQIGTGEGKSLTLAVASCVLALVGFDVNCACYSKYLSKRDYQSYLSLFSVFGVANNIHYGTFGELCERVINSTGNVRSMVENMILPSERKDDMNTINDGYDLNPFKCKILLIDEVDVFVSNEFYGRVYAPAARLESPEISVLIDLIWKNHGSDDDSKSESKTDSTRNLIHDSPEYKTCEKLFGEWSALLNEAIKDMLADIQTFKSTEYLVHNGKIGYKQLDTIDTSIVYGYKTLFSYYFEHGKGEISEETLNQQKCIWLCCGRFSYAEIAQKFDVICGVSGTLKTLSDGEKSIMQETYSISRYTYMPSLFKQSLWVPNFKFDKTGSSDVCVVDEKYFYDNLTQQIQKRLNDHKSPRCVFVFFEDKKKLTDFYECKEFARYRCQHNLLTMTEELNENEKNMRVTQSCLSGAILLTTRSYGRGTDFQVRDPLVLNNGGPHVIQTFLSEQRSEETQIKGRTARQGSDGSYSMILNRSDLDKYNISDDDVTNARNMYGMLDKKRNQFFEEQYQSNSEFVRKAHKSHEMALNLRDLLHEKADNSLEIKKILLSLNAGACLGHCTKVAVLMDATASMGSLLLKAKHTTSEMFVRISSILESHFMDPKSFELQFIAYRNYNAPPEKLLEYSGWCSDATQLTQFLNGIDASYGWGNEAIEIAFNHVNYLMDEKNDDISQIILIGDAGPNTRNDVKTKRTRRGENECWKTSKFSNATYWEDELNGIIDKKIKINAFYLKPSAQAPFEEIGKRAGGICDCLDIDSKQGAETLTHLVSRSVLAASGGDDLVRAYDQTYMKVQINQ